MWLVEWLARSMVDGIQHGSSPETASSAAGVDCLHAAAVDDLEYEHFASFAHHRGVSARSPVDRRPRVVLAFALWRLLGTLARAKVERGFGAWLATNLVRSVGCERACVCGSTCGQCRRFSQARHRRARRLVAPDRDPRVRRLETPLFEELVFRGVVFSELLRLSGLSGAAKPLPLRDRIQRAWLANLGASLVFVGMHWPWWIFTEGLATLPMRSLPVFLLSLVLGVVFARGRSLWPCVWLHWLNNSLSQLADG